jgi:two-component system, NtrC family, nitrogen regulation sensor histidine kinase NtrY
MSSFRSFDFRLLLAILLPGALATYSVWQLPWHWEWKLTALLSVALVSFYLVSTARGSLITRLNTVAAVLDALRHGDYSVRARQANVEDPIGQVVWQANAMAEVLKNVRFGAMDATSLLDSAMEQMEVAIFTFDAAENIRYSNRQARELLQRNDKSLVGVSAYELGIASLLHQPTSSADMTTVEFSFPQKSGRWGIRTSIFREAGLPLKLLAITDLSRTLREEERLAWQRLIRVLTHELNNSVAPIRSLAGTLKTLVGQQPRPDDWEQDLGDGLSIIEGRSSSLAKFIESYSRLAKLPPPERSSHDLNQLAIRIAKLESRLPVQIQTTDQPLMVMIDVAQMEQVLINLIKNAVEASLIPAKANGKGEGQVTVKVERSGNQGLVEVRDDGPGLANAANLFVPFFTTKAGGSGIGLALSRQIVDAHEGSLTLENRVDQPGCMARVSLPLISAD